MVVLDTFDRLGSGKTKKILLTTTFFIISCSTLSFLPIFYNTEKISPISLYVFM